MKSTRRYQNIATRLLGLYPRSWRERYEDEVMAVLEECPITLKTVVSLFLGMVDAHLHLSLFPATEFQIAARLRTSQVTVFSAFLLFPAALLLATFYYHSLYFHGFASFQVLSLDLRAASGSSWPADFWGFDNWFSDDQLLLVFPRTGQIQGLLLRHIMHWCGLVGLLATLLGAIWLVAVSLKQAWVQKRRSFVLLFLTWPVSFVLMVVLRNLSDLVRGDLQLPSSLLDSLSSTLRFEEILGNSPLIPLLRVSLWILTAWFFAGGPICLLLGVRKADFSLRSLRISSVLALLTTLGMSGVLAAKIYLVLALHISVPDPLYPMLPPQLEDPLYHLATLWLALLTLLAVVTLWRGFKAHRKLKLV